MITFDIGMNFVASCNLNRMLLSVKYSCSMQVTREQKQNKNKLEREIYHKKPRNCDKAKIRFFHGDRILTADQFSWLNMLYD